MQPENEKNIMQIDETAEKTKLEQLQAEKEPMLEPSTEAVDVPEELAEQMATKTSDAITLKKVRESLGIESEPSEDGPISVKAEKVFISPDLIRNYENSIQNLSDYIKKLSNILRDRSEGNFPELIDDNDIARMTRSINSLQEIKLSGPEDLEETSKAFAKINDAIESIGSIRSQNKEDDPESMKSVSYALMMVSEGATDVSRQLKSMETPESVRVSRQLDRLTDLASDKRMLILRRLDQISD